ncbi:hypothetical protein [Paenibacillus sp. 1-18]|uniref:hypothetical protein n=1 Tax=Paenibacillus sp. 1-18 TaxID=1333846 RepID=UPI00046EB145|nr:hypothetical protein [Paenibacillus sp. 1-18]
MGKYEALTDKELLKELSVINKELIQRFGSFKEACRLAGVVYKSKNEKLYTNEDILEKMREIAGPRRQLSRVEYDEANCYPNSQTIIRRFGYFSRACELAGGRVSEEEIKE